MTKPAPAPHRIACARILCEVWPRRDVAAALGVTVDTLDKWGVRAPRPSLQQRLREKLLATGASRSEVARMLGVSRQAVYEGEKVARKKGATRPARP